MVHHGPEKAIEYAERAGDDASTGLALEDGARYYGMALRALDLLPRGPVVDDKRFELHTERGRTFFQVGQWASAKTEFELALNFLNPVEQESAASSLTARRSSRETARRRAVGQN
jgi:hypothetical protein